MKVYIVTESHRPMVGAEELKIIKVRPELEATFLEEYAGRILVTGDSIQDVLIKFGQYKNDQDQ